MQLFSHSAAWDTCAAQGQCASNDAILDGLEDFKPVMYHYGVQYGVRLYGTVREYGVQPYLYGFRLYIRLRYGVRYGPNFESLSQKI